MLFTQPDFALFFVAVFALTWATTDLRVRKIVLVVASALFYASWDARFLPVLGFCILVTHGAGALVAPAQRSRSGVLTLALLLLVGNLLVFRYANFILGSLFSIAPSPTGHVLLIEALAPLGLSFFTFQAISYIVDVHRGHLRPRSLLDVAVLMSFFPHLLAGPIVRGADLLPQLEHPARLLRRDALLGVVLVGLGLFKKTVVATPMATQFADPCFGAAVRCSGPDALLAVYAYSAQIFCDFSGYSDLAIGLALLLGLRFPVNFDGPYAATSLVEFWRRWHISLSSWIRDYLYIPLGGSRISGRRTAFNLLLVMAIAGLWHGASPNFLMWGLAHGCGLVLLHGLATLRGSRHPSERPVWYRLPAALLTFHIVALLWIPFRIADASDVRVFLSNLFDWSSLHGSSNVADAAEPWSLALLATGLLLGCVRARHVEWLVERLWQPPGLVAGGALGAFLLGVQAVRETYGIEPFIYFRF